MIRYLSFLSDFGHSIAEALGVCFDFLVRDFTLIGNGCDAFLEVYAARNAGDVVQSLHDAVCALFAVHAFDYKNLGCDDGFQFLLSGLVVAGAAAAALPACPLDKGADRSQDNCLQMEVIVCIIIWTFQRYEWTL